jgi:phosphotriesterase-related protein
VNEVQTVLGRIPAESIGFTLPHEHTRCVLWHIEGRWDYWQLTGEEDIIAAELGRFREAGGSCLVDVSLQSIGRDPARLRRLAEATGLHLVMSCGWYRQAYYPAEARIGRRSVDDLAAELLGEFEAGAEGTGIRPGIIGEIGTDKPWLTGEEERVHRAAARAARATGMAVTTHAVMSDVGLAQLHVFDEEGLDPGRVIIGHADSNPRLEYQLGIIERGANLEFDFLGMAFTPAERHGEPRLIRLLLDLLGRGHVGRILLSQDVCHDAQLKAYQGNGYVYLIETFLPRLRAAGVDEPSIQAMTVDNPRRLLTLASPNA